jgi:lysophospholipase L1-like esterase
MKKIIIILCVVLLLPTIYLNRSYAHIFNKIADTALTSSDSKHTYSFGGTSGKTIKYVSIGDSLTSGVGVDSFENSYPYQLAKKYSTKGDAVILHVASIPGAKSEDIVKDFLDAAIQKKPDIFTLLIGVNDVYGNISEKEFTRNYRIILNRLTTETKAKIYIINLPYLGSKSLILPPYDRYFGTRTTEFNKILLNLAVEYRLNYVDLYSKSQLVSKEDSYYAADQFHPSKIGYAQWANIIHDSINK